MKKELIVKKVLFFSESNNYVLPFISFVKHLIIVDQKTANVCSLINLNLDAQGAIVFEAA